MMLRHFSDFAVKTSRVTGSAWFFIVNIVLTIIWIAAGPFYNWSEGWNFLANSSTTVLTWNLAVLLLHTQNRDTEAIQLKLAELVRASENARDRLATIEDVSAEERAQEYTRMREGDGGR